MIKLYSASNSAELGLMKSLLESADIETIVRGNLSMMVGDLPPSDAWPQLWLINEEDLPKAQEILNQRDPASNSVETDWICPDCGEENEGQFDSCWKCSAARPA